jgi:hypothetical protein
VPSGGRTRTDFQKQIFVNKENREKDEIRTAKEWTIGKERKGKEKRGKERRRTGKERKVG